MNKATFVIGVIVILALLFVGFALYSTPQTGGAIASQNSVTPNAAVVEATGSFATTTLAAVTNSTSSVVTTVNISNASKKGLQLGDTCFVQLSSATSTLGFSADAQITAVSTTNATATVTPFNAATSSITLGAGKLTLVCYNF